MELAHPPPLAGRESTQQQTFPRLQLRCFYVPHSCLYVKKKMKNDLPALAQKTAQSTKRWFPPPLNKRIAERVAVELSYEYIRIPPYNKNSSWGRATVQADK